MASAVTIRNPRSEMPVDHVVTCPTCKVIHSDITPYAWQQRKYYCRECRKEISRVIYQRDPEKHLAPRRGEKNRSIMMKHRYGLSIESWQDMVDAQQGCCALCDTYAIDPKKLKIDHNHETGQVRGLLCNNCNAGLGMFDENPYKLQKAINYINKHNPPKEESTTI